MTGLRSNKTEEGSHEYVLGTAGGVTYTACCMANDEWCIFAGNTDTGQDFKTLRDARKWWEGRQ